MTANAAPRPSSGWPRRLGSGKIDILILAPSRPPTPSRGAPSTFACVPSPRVRKPHRSNFCVRSLKRVVGYRPLPSMSGVKALACLRKARPSAHQIAWKSQAERQTTTSLTIPKPGRRRYALIVHSLNFRGFHETNTHFAKGAVLLILC